MSGLVPGATRDSAAAPAPSIAASAQEPVYPLKASANRRYLVDQRNEPFLMVGDAPQLLLCKLSPDQAAAYMTNRQHYGVNALWINLLCNLNELGNDHPSTPDGIAPFTAKNDLATPNPYYFRRVDTILGIAAAHGMVVLLDPIETSGWLPVLRANGMAKAFAYGQYLGRRYKDTPNIIWLHGNDFQSWRNPNDDALVQAVALGIRGTDKSHIHTAELNYLSSGTLDDTTWETIIDLDAVYTYFPTYAQTIKEYNRRDFKPVFLIEANYEFEHLPLTDGGSLSNLRRQEYWTMLSGATGQVYGSHYTWNLPSDWQRKVDSPGVRQLGYMKGLFMPYRWYDLIPDQTHSVVTAGYHGMAGYMGEIVNDVGRISRMKRVLDAFRRFTGIGSISTNTYVSAARTPDGALLIAYMPTRRTITVDMSRLAGRAIGHWYDPTDGRSLDIPGAPLRNAGERQFTPPGRNSAGDDDWVLVLQVADNSPFNAAVRRNPYR